ncbi:hypothetical protein BDF19DRAFT_207704 [Syncephalis fuscata]|nr:hypothetical protein BDF19DRAFT_207704 [Syncephalis fuscata]
MSLRRASIAWSFSNISFSKEGRTSSRLSSAAATTIGAAVIPTSASPVNSTITTTTPLKPVYVTVRQARSLLPSGIQASKEAVQAVNTFLDELVIRFCGEIPTPVTRTNIRVTAEHMFLPGALQEACIRACALNTNGKSGRKLDLMERMFGCWTPYTSHTPDTSLDQCDYYEQPPQQQEPQEQQQQQYYHQRRPHHSTFTTTTLSKEDTQRSEFSHRGSHTWSSVSAHQYFQRQPSSSQDAQESMEDLATCIGEEQHGSAMLNSVELCDLFRHQAAKSLSFRRTGIVRDVSGARMSKRRRRAYAEHLILLGCIIREVARHLAAELGLHAQRCDRRMVAVRDLLALLDTDPQLESIFRFMQLRDDLRASTLTHTSGGFSNDVLFIIDGFVSRCTSFAYYSVDPFICTIKTGTTR